MRRRLGSAALLVALAPATGCSSAPQERPGGADGELRLPHAAEPQLLRAGDGLVLLAVRTTDEGPQGAVVTATLDGATWSPVETLSTRGATVSTPRVAVNDDGAGVAAWSELPSGANPLEDFAPTVARIRRTDGSWEDRFPLPGIAYVDDLAVNAHGDVAVLGTSDDGVPSLALHPADASWRTTPLDWPDATRIALDEDGGVHAVVTGTERGGGGTVATRHLPPDGAWTAPEPVDVGHTATEPARILTLPGGGEAVVVGLVSTTWQSTFDTEYYWATAYDVLQRQDLDEPLEVVWSKDGATELQARVVEGAVELAWLQESGGVPLEGAEARVQVPTREVLTAARVGGPEETLAQVEVRRALDDAFGGAEIAPGAGCAELAWLWRPVGVDGVPQALAARVGHRSVDLPPDADPLPPGLHGSLACAGGAEPWLASVEDAVRVGSADSDDVRLTEATVVVRPLA